LEADSLDVYEIAMSLEEKFNIPISDDEADNFVTVGDAIAFIKGKVTDWSRTAGRRFLGT
jgi:acyl carrier protein